MVCYNDQLINFVPVQSVGRGDPPPPPNWDPHERNIRPDRKWHLTLYWHLVAVDKHPTGMHSCSEGDFDMNWCILKIVCSTWTFIWEQMFILYSCLTLSTVVCCIWFWRRWCNHGIHLKYLWSSGKTYCSMTLQPMAVWPNTAQYSSVLGQYWVTYIWVIFIDIYPFLIDEGMPQLWWKDMVLHNQPW